MLSFLLAQYVDYLRAETTTPRRYYMMKKITAAAVIAALTLVTQAFAMGGTKGGQSMSSARSTTINSGSRMMTPAGSMTSTARMNGTGNGAKTIVMSATGTTMQQMTPDVTVPTTTTKQ